jgi:Prokaryotic membrane lipoprotein lipid attachment site
MKKLFILFTAILVLTACQSKPNRPSVPAPSAHSLSVSALQRINNSAYECWAKDKDFKAYGIIPELDTTGTPRILIIPKGKPQALPKLVITATGKSVQTFGPLAGSPLAPRINADVARWAAGGTGCAA